MRVFLTGASGLIGGRLAEGLLHDGHQVCAISRRPRSGTKETGGEAGAIEWVVGDVGLPGAWSDALEGCDAVVHLAGEPVASGRWTKARKRRLISSRVESSRLMVAALARAKRPPRTLVCASASGYYGARGDEELSEASHPGDDFLARLCVDWENAANAASSAGVRVVALRFGVVLSPHGGALARMLLPFKLGLGGPLGPASRWFPWVHEDDAVGLARFALEHPIAGPLNVVAPGSVTMGEFAKALGRALHRPALLPLPEALLQLVLGEMASGLFPGQKIEPRVAITEGYIFRHSTLAKAFAASL
jgi:uncharacterized protein (TIGR01777 family)